jgi:hypothetical protein
VQAGLAIGGIGAASQRARMMASGSAELESSGTFVASGSVMGGNPPTVPASPRIAIGIGIGL